MKTAQENLNKKNCTRKTLTCSTKMSAKKIKKVGGKQVPNCKKKMQNLMVHIFFLPPPAKPQNCKSQAMCAPLHTRDRHLTVSPLPDQKITVAVICHLAIETKLVTLHCVLGK